ncbi:hypothetical protein E2L05_03575 [Meridianimarinicoccus aquatilis]|uniref:Uncharacterized protein n=1 Tax=Meridianimarinicoccus aquatilis TaxID=2552766 RepID=A0A4R6B2K7_9RHOB|nr:hypothetical protein E2L05_03575 [Fluviibacterium aquatile]
MPHKFNVHRRAHIPKQKHRVTNWAAYNERHCQVADVKTSGWVAVMLNIEPLSRIRGVRFPPKSADADRQMAS